MVVIKNEELCTAGSDHAVFSWVTPGQKADTTVYLGEAPGTLIKYTGLPDTEYHLAEVRGLKPSTRYWYAVASGGASGPLNSFVTLPAPGGKLIFSLGLISDTHIALEDSVNDVNEKYFGKLSKYSGVLFEQCVRDIKARNINLALIVGDLSDSSSGRQYQVLGKALLPAFGDTPYLACIGNHDKYLKNAGLGELGFLKYVAGRAETRASFNILGHQLILIDSCGQNKDWGEIGDEQISWVVQRLKEAAGRPSFLFLHHPCNGFDVWFGTKDFRKFQQAIRRFPDVRGVFCGHMHRHYVSTSRFMTGSLPYVVLPATVQFPCSYAVMRVHEKGFEYNAYKISRLDLSEMSRESTILKDRGRAVFSMYSFGGIGDRSITYSSGRLHRHKQYELSVTLEHKKAMELFMRTQSAGGASCVPAAESGKTRVILGRYDSPGLALSSRLSKIPLYGIKASIIKEGSFSLPEEFIKTYYE
ncbi:metallophosphoesterase [Pelotomaculum propionicicum]|uniref:metallophosphoesterase n=1 Tax=Pelotomaculum propionicicum TaxID=258475 RepID=UPI003B78EF12